jgi:transglutaminase-like putative cysteine protease
VVKPIPHPERATHQVSSHLELRCLAPSTLALTVSVSSAAAVAGDEALTVISGEREVEVVELVDHHGTRSHVVQADEGPLIVDYQASVAASPAPALPASRLQVTHLEALRPSRYCPSDALTGFARATFGPGDPDSATAHRVAEWVHGFASYESGSSGHLDTAVETLVLARGVCRDFAHLTIALCRGLGIPARLVAAYAPGLSPMDFHAVVEAHTEHGWEVLDSTRLAPRSSLLRIATGRDAADTAFVSTIGGDVALDVAEVLAIVEDDLPDDDHTGVVRLA